MGNERDSEASDAEAAWTPAGGSDVLLVSRQRPLIEDMERIAAVSAVSLSVVPDLEEAGPSWERCPVVVIGNDILDVPRHRRRPLILIGTSADASELWHQASVAGAERVVTLPDGAQWFAEYLGRRQDTGPDGFVLGVTGGCGGAGASTLAAWLACRAAEEGVRTLLIDGDRWGGGLELALATEELAGLRWPDIAGARGTIDPRQLQEALPSVEGFSVLSWGAEAGPVSGGAGQRRIIGDVLEAARRGYELTVVDVGRTSDSLEGFAWSCDRLLVVVPGRLRAAVAAAALVRELPGIDTSLVVRGPLASGMDAEMIAESIGQPLAAYCSRLRGVSAAAEAGVLLGLAKQRPVRRMTSAILSGLTQRPRA